MSAVVAQSPEAKTRVWAVEEVLDMLSVWSHVMWVVGLVVLMREVLMAMLQKLSSSKKVEMQLLVVDQALPWAYTKTRVRRVIVNLLQ